MLRERFAYAVEPLPERARSYYKPTLELQPLGDGESLAIGAIAVTAFAQDHGFSTTVGYRFGEVAYSTDVVQLSEARSRSSRESTPGSSARRFAVRVVHAETGVLLTRLCRRCAGDLVAPPLPRHPAGASEAAR